MQRRGRARGVSNYYWDDRAGRYRDARGRYVSEAKIRDGVDRVVLHASRNMYTLAQEFRTTDMTVGQWRDKMLNEVKLAHTAVALAVYGGKEHMGPREWGIVGQIIRQQYQYVQKFAQDILDGRQQLNGRMDARAALYGQAARSTYENMRRTTQQVYARLFERNVLGARESCVECQAETLRGWVPVGMLKPIGGRLCRSACKCTFAYEGKLPAGGVVVVEPEIAAAS